MNSPVAERVNEWVRSVSDPELPGVTIGDLGMVRGVQLDVQNVATVDLVPTFLGCPALGVIATDVRTAALAAGAADATVRFDHSIPWSPSQTSPAGRRALADLGVVVAELDGTLRCPYCGDGGLRPLAPVGPAACRSSWWCGECSSAVDVMREPGDSTTPAVPVTLARRPTVSSIN